MRILGTLIVRIFAVLFIIEVSLRLTGFALSWNQREHNDRVHRETGVRILVLGESTSAKISSTWVDQLANLLDENAKSQTFQVINEATPGTNTAYILARLTQNLDKYQPQIVITMMGINDHYSLVRYSENLETRIRLSIGDFRVYKIIRWFIETVRQHRSQPDLQQYKNRVITLADQGRTDEAIALVKKAIAENPKDGNLYANLGWLYEGTGRFRDAELMFQTAKTFHPSGQLEYLGLGMVYYRMGRLKKAEIMLIKALHLTGLDPLRKIQLFRTLTKVYEDMGVPDGAIKYRLTPYLEGPYGQDIGLTFATSSADTSYHYRKLHQILQSRGIRHIAMQYPTLPVEDLKKLLGNPTDVIFVSNEENFRTALENASYEDLFRDRFGGSFGHTTRRGGELIARAAADAIWSIQNKTSIMR